MTDTVSAAVYGFPPREVIETPRGAVQTAPTVPGAQPLEGLADASLDAFVVLAPAGAVERRYVLAQALRTLKPGGRLTVAAPKDRGGLRLKKELSTFGCTIGEDARRHHRICVTLRPEAPTGLAEALAEGAPRRIDGEGLWTQPGVFSWDRLDTGTALLMQALPAFAGAGADLGCGIGVLAHQVLASPKVTKLALIDIDRRALDAAQRNVDDARVSFSHADIRLGLPELSNLDFVVSNPPFHEGGGEDKALGQAFIRGAAALLKKGGVLWLVANRHLPYEAVLADHFARVRPVVDQEGFKVLEAVK